MELGIQSRMPHDHLPQPSKTIVNWTEETLSILFACERFHGYLYGRKFKVINDHQPLRSISQKPLKKSPLRIQRFRLRLQKYEFDFLYVPGKQLQVADALSRAYLSEHTSEISYYMIRDGLSYVHNLIPKTNESLFELYCAKT